MYPVLLVQKDVLCSHVLRASVEKSNEIETGISVSMLFMNIPVYTGSITETQMCISVLIFSNLLH
jgi:hypothetical protein